MTNNHIKVIDAPGLVRDPYSKAIIVADSSALIEHRKKKTTMMALLNKNKNLETEVSILKDRLEKMESLLNRLAQQIEK